MMNHNTKLNVNKKAETDLIKVRDLLLLNDKYVM